MQTEKAFLLIHAIVCEVRAQCGSEWVPRRDNVGKRWLLLAENLVKDAHGTVISNEDVELVQLTLDWSKPLAVADQSHRAFTFVSSIP